MQQNDDAVIFDAVGNPFHVPGTRIYRERDGGLIYECPHCGRNQVPRSLTDDLAKYAAGTPRNVVAEHEVSKIGSDHR